MACLYTNENFPLPAVKILRDLGHDVLTIQEIGKSDQSMPDEAVLEFAIHEKRTLISLNRKHFIRLHQQKPDHSGIIVCSFDSDFISLAKRIHEAIADNRELSGVLIRVNRPE